MSSLKGPGERIEARCTRCNDVTGHVIVALVGGVVVKVECCACGSVHKYYPPVSAKDAAAGTARRSSAERKSATGEKAKTPRGQARAAQAATATENAWRTAMERPSAPAAKVYSMTAPLAIGDTIEHPVFGLGSVRSIIPPNKAEILFRDGMRLLRCAG